MKFLITGLPLLLVSIALTSCKTVSTTYSQPDGRVLYLSISSNGEVIASTIAGVQYHNQEAPKNIWDHLDRKTVFETRDMIHSDSEHLRKPPIGARKVLKGGVTVLLGYSADEALDSVTVDELALTYAGSDTQGDRWHVTQWSIGVSELTRLRAAWQEARK